MTTISTWKPRTKGKSGRETWWIKSSSNQLISRNKLPKEKWKLKRYRITIRVSARSETTMASKKTGRIQLRIDKGSSMKNSHKRYRAPIARKLLRECKRKWTITKRCAIAMIKKKSLLSDRSNRQGSSIINSWRCSLRRGIILNSSMILQLLIKVRRSCKQSKIRRWTNILTRIRSKCNKDIKICSTSSSKSKTTSRCMVTCLQSKKPLTKTTFAPTKTSTTVNSLWCQASSTQSTCSPSQLITLPQKV